MDNGSISVKLNFIVYLTTIKLKIMDKPVIAEKFPIAVTVEKDKNYAWCTCGLSSKQPFCDGKHKEIEGMPYKPLVMKFEEEKEIWFCQCKHTKNAPFCDGSHKEL
jgi:CDGSH-type Zn-finger protein